MTWRGKAGRESKSEAGGSRDHFRRAAKLVYNLRMDINSPAIIANYWESVARESRRTLPEKEVYEAISHLLFADKESRAYIDISVLS